MLNLFNKKKKNTYNLLGNENYIIKDYMLNYFKLKDEILFLDNSHLVFFLQKKKSLNKTRHYPSATKEWFNSTYSYNKNYIKSLIVADKLVKNLFFFYFNLSSRYIIRFRKKFRRKSLVKYVRNLRAFYKYVIRYSADKTFVSRAEMKHNNEKIIITVFTYNKVRNYLVKKLLKKKLKKSLLRRFIKFFIKVNNKNILKVKQSVKIQNLKKKLFLKNLLKSIVFVTKRKNNIKNIKKLFFFNYLYKNLNLSSLGLGLSTLISKIYSKKIEFNIVYLKAIYLNSDILSDSIVLKLENSKNKIYFVLNRALSFVKITPLRVVLWNKNTVDNTLYLKEKKRENILNSIKYKAITGVRLEGSGRLTRRMTAARAIFKYRYKGNLKNIESSLINKRSVMLRGHFKPNLQYTNISSKTRIGAFGLKGWVSSF